MCYPVYGIVHIKDPLLLIGKSSPCSGSSRFPLSLYEWFFTIYPMPYNCIWNVLSASLNKNFIPFFKCLAQCQLMVVKTVALIVQWYIYSLNSEYIFTQKTPKRCKKKTIKSRNSCRLAAKSCLYADYLSVNSVDDPDMCAWTFVDVNTTNNWADL